MSFKNLPIFILLFLLFSCKKDFIPQESSRVEINDFMIEELEYKYLSTKSKIQYKNENQLINATVNMRIENGVKIWFSVRVALGVEAARGLITRDEFVIIDRVNKQVIKSSLDIVEKEFKMKLSFDQLESALTGNLLYGISDSDVIRKEGSYFKIIQEQERYSFISEKGFRKTDNADLTGEDIINMKNRNLANVPKILLKEITSKAISFCLDGVELSSRQIFRSIK